ncbi:MAG: hypothetical protein JST39_15755, partial [Bacteroidetes bacterium]|nr:hypothetical protein [Bacteroidota bacterium]
KKPAVERADHYNRLGLTYSSEGYTAQALDNYRAACAVWGIPDSSRAIYTSNIAHEYWDSNPDSARYYYNEAINLCVAGSVHQLYYRAHVAMLDHDMESVVKLLLQSHLVDSSYLPANNMLGILFIGDYDKKYTDPRRALRFNKLAFNGYGDAGTAYILGRNYYMLNMTENAVSMFEKALNYSPYKTNYIKTLIMVDQELGRREQADSLLEVLRDKDTTVYNSVINSSIQEGDHTITWNND